MCIRDRGIIYLLSSLSEFWIFCSYANIEPSEVPFHYQGVTSIVLKMPYKGIYLLVDNSFCFQNWSTFLDTDNARPRFTYSDKTRALARLRFICFNKAKASTRLRFISTNKTKDITKTRASLLVDEVRTNTMMSKYHVKVMVSQPFLWDTRAHPVFLKDTSVFVKDPCALI